MRIATFNANSIRARLDIILAWLEEENPDILCVQETKVQDREFPAEAIRKAGYSAVYRGQKSYNGVALVSKEPLGGIRPGLYGARDEEARFLTARLRGITVINVYIPQGYEVGTDKFDYKLKWMGDLLEHIKETYDPSHPLLMAGDFNVALEAKDVFDSKRFQGQVGFHPEEQKLLRKFLDWGFVDVFREHKPEGGHFTFWDYRIPNGFKRNMGWRIDYILATSPVAEKSQAAWIDTRPRTLQRPSDHTFLVADFNIHK